MQYLQKKQQLLNAFLLTKKYKNIANNPVFQRSIAGLKTFYNEINHYRPFLKKRVNYDCHYAAAIREKLIKKLTPGKANTESKKPIAAAKAKPKHKPKPKPVAKPVAKPAQNPAKKPGFISRVKNAAKAGAKAVGKGFKAFGSALKKGFNKGVQGVKNAPAAIKNTIKKAATKVKNIAKKVKNAVVKAVKSLKPKKKTPISAAGGKIFDYYQDNYDDFTKGLMAFLKSRLFNSLVKMINCLKSHKPSESLARLIIGLSSTVKQIIQKDYIDIAMDVLCQWDKLKEALDQFGLAFKPENKDREWEYLAVAVSKMLEILKV